MKLDKKKILNYLGVFYIVITGLFNIFGYFHLPDTVATHFSFSGKITRRTSTPVYLFLSFAIVLLLSIYMMKKEGEQKIKYIVADTLIIIIHFVMVIMQLQ